MSIFGVMLCTFALTLTSCGDTACANSDESFLEDHSCCAVEETTTHSHEDGTEHSHEGDDEGHTYNEGNDEESAE